MTATRLPLFPLGTVLFPGLLLPLHVFEERYRQLVRDLLVGPHESRAFGVVAIREGREVGADSIRALHGVGCVARLRRVEPYDDGRFDVVTSGSQRFRLLAVDNSRPYLQGDVELLGEPDGQPAPDSQPGLRRRTPTTGRRSGSPTTSPPTTPAPCPTPSPPARSSTSPTGSGCSRRRTPPSRLRAELALLRRETTLLGLLPSLPGGGADPTPREPELSPAAARGGGTPATVALAKAGVEVALHPYEHAAGAPSYGGEAADALGLSHDEVFKTLVARVDGRLVTAVVPVSGTLDLKALAAAMGGKKAAMAEPADAERATGYVVGGISPIGQRSRLPVVVDDSVLALAAVYVSAGRRGLQVRLAPADLLRVTGARTAPLRRAG